MERLIDKVVYDGKALDSFTCGYITAMLWSSTDNEGDPLDDNHTWHDIADKTMAVIMADCVKFQSDNAHLIANDPEMAGIDFWLTRNHHGSGFWDGDWGQFGDALILASHAYGERNLYVGDDGKLCL